MDENLLRFNKQATFCFIDFETENLCLNLRQNLPWQVAMLNVVGDVTIAKYMRYIQWWRPPNVGVEAARITRFTPELVTEKGWPYQDVIKDVVEWTQAAEFIIGHNVLGFDIHFLIGIYELVNADPSKLAEKVIDTHALAKGLKLGNPFDKKRHQLLEYQYQQINTRVKGVKTNTVALGTEYGIDHEYENLHDALVDLELNKKIWDKLKFQIDI